MPGDWTTQRFAVQNHVIQDQMCNFAPTAVADLMRMFVEAVSPDWSTVQMEIVANRNQHTWVMRLSGQGIARPGGERG